MDVSMDYIPNYDYKNTECIEMTEEMYLALKEAEESEKNGCKYYTIEEVMKEFYKLYN